MVKLLAVSDERDERLTVERLERIRPDLIVSCGDLRPDYLDFVGSAAGVPMLYVPGNHDPDAAQRAAFRGLITNLPPQPSGTNLDGIVTTVGGLRFAGLGGSVRYRPGPNQYTQPQMNDRVDEMIRAERRSSGDGVERLDVLVTHAPPFGAGDGSDPAHRGFRAFHRMIEVFAPQFMLHGHVHPYGFPRPDRRIASTVVLNVIPHRIVEVTGTREA